MTDLFEVESGFLVDGASFIAGTATPGSAGGEADEVGVGSYYLKTADGTLWIKDTAGTGTNKWKQMATQAYVQTFFSGAISWREPVIVHDDTATSLPTETPTNPITVDGESITDGQRVLFSAISGGAGPNVYIYDQDTGTFSEDANGETAGDRVYVIDGTDAGREYTYNGTAWVLSNQATQDELGFIRAFIGKNATGSENPVYTSVTQVTQNNSLEAAIGELDAAIGADVTPVSRTNNPIVGANDVNTNLEELDSAIGTDAQLTPVGRSIGQLSLADTVYSGLDNLDAALGADPSPVARTNSPISTANASNANIDALDAAIGVDVSPVARTIGAISASNTVNQNVDALDAAIGVDISPLTRTVGVLAASNTVNQNIDQLDTVVGANADMVSVVEIATTNNIYTNLSNLDETLALAYRVVTDKTNVTTDTLLDEVLVDSVAGLTWEVLAEGNLTANADDKYAVKVGAIHNGHNKGGGLDATDTDIDQHSVRKLGTNLQVALSVVLAGTGASQTMQLRATAGTASDFKIRRTEIFPTF